MAFDYREAIGYTRLQQALGKRLPDGAGLHVAQVEAPLRSDPGFWHLASAGSWWPDATDEEFEHKRFAYVSAKGDGAHSGHASGAGRLFYGRESSIAPGITRIDLYNATEWINTVLRSGSVFYPGQMSARVVNHSWVGSTGSPVYDSELLRRLDWSVNADRSLHVVGISNGEDSPALLGNAFNVIPVGRSDGHHGTSTVAVDSVYREGRSLPLLVAPFETASSATPVVAAAAALLVQSAHRYPTFSQSSVRTLEGEVLYDAERPEVIKAILMAGADRVASNDDGTSVSDYRGSLDRRTDNGLDRRYGAGQLNVLNSYAILSGGEQRSSEDSPKRRAAVAWYGFDFDSDFGGAGGSNALATYRFTADSSRRWLTATLAWNVTITTSGDTFEANVLLHDLDLELYDEADDRPVAVSASWSQNTESLWLPLTSGHSYRLVVRAAGEGEAPFQWRYALAWRIDAGQTAINVSD